MAAAGRCVGGQGLAVQPPLRRQHQVRAREPGIEIQNIQDQLRPGPQVGTAKGPQTKAQATGRAGAGLIPS